MRIVSKSHHFVFGYAERRQPRFVRMEKKEIKKQYRQQRKTFKTDYKNKKSEAKREKRRAFDEYYAMRTPPTDTTPKRSTLEEIGNSVTHGVGALFAIVAFILMLLTADSALKYVGASVYFVGLFVMFTMSCLYHSFRHGMAVKRLFRRFDYSCIYLLIGATFAPILLCYIGGTLGTVFFIVQWAVIAFGITMVGVFGPSRLRFIHIPLYVVLGWSGLMLIPNMLEKGDYSFFAFILGGGVIYSLGIIPFAIKAKVSHFIWHFFVLFGAVVQFIGVYTTIYL